MARTSSSDGTEIAFSISGEGEPVLFVHGTGTWSSDWLLVLPLLKDRFTVVAMDRRGRGQSGDAAEYAMEREAEDVLAVLEATGAELLVGHSYGALCSMLAVQRTGRLRRMVLYEPPIAVQEHSATSLERLVRQGRHEEALVAFLTGAGAPPGQLRRIRESAAWPRLVATAPTLPRELRAASRWRHPQGPVDVETLFLLGAETSGRAFLEGLDDLQARFPGARRETIPGQQHVAHVFAPQEFARVVAGFLEAA